jgi:hypothetical protein
MSVGATCPTAKVVSSGAKCECQKPTNGSRKNAILVMARIRQHVLLPGVNVLLGESIDEEVPVDASNLGGDGQAPDMAAQDSTRARKKMGLVNASKAPLDRPELCGVRTNIIRFRGSRYSNSDKLCKLNATLPISAFAGSESGYIVSTGTSPPLLLAFYITVGISVQVQFCFY